jgi:5-formyltetrahydrofolate cyclo-ligase
MILEAGLKLGKSLSLPRVEGHRITFREFASEKQLISGSFGIPEPPPDCKESRPDLVIVPGVAFDRRGYRLGYGRAFYDRYLSENPTFSVGAAYSLQVVERIPRRRHDRRVDALATEIGLITFGA